MPKTTPIKDVLAANLNRLMKSDSTLSTCKKLSMRSGVGNGTVDRLRKGKAVCNIETLEALSRAFKREPWQLLVENFDPKNPPSLRGNTEQEKKFYEFIETLTKK